MKLIAGQTCGPRPLLPLLVNETTEYSAGDLCSLLKSLNTLHGCFIQHGRIHETAAWNANAPFKGHWCTRSALKTPIRTQHIYTNLVSNYHLWFF